MPTLHWVGKDRVVNHHHDVPFRVLKKEYTFTITGTTYKNQTPCAIVYVAKVGNPPVTTITSHGYNTCSQSALQLERVFQVTY